MAVRVTGVDFFDFLDGQAGVAPNGIELYPVVDIAFNPSPTCPVVESLTSLIASRCSIANPVASARTVSRSLVFSG